jgi:hypothetical protein
LVTVLSLLALAGGSLYWILSASPLSLWRGGVTQGAVAPIFLPKQTPVMVSLLVNPDKLEAFSLSATSVNNRRQSHRELKDFEKSLLANTGLNYEQEIQPWLGEEITLAVTSLDYDRQTSNGTQPGYLLAVNSKNPQLAKEFLQSSYSKQSLSGTFELVDETYKGVNILYQKPLFTGANNRFLASAVIRDFVLFANDAKVIKEAINNIQVPALNLQNSPSYQEALTTLAEPRIAIAYANIPALSAWIANAPNPETPEVLQRLMIGLSLKSQGLVAQTALIGVNGESQQPPLLATPVSTLAYIPEDSWLTASGRDLANLWQEVSQGLEADSPLQQLVMQSLKRLQKPLGVDLPQEIFSWVTGDFSLALLPNPAGEAPDWLFVTEKLPDAQVDNIVNKFDELAKEKGYSVGNLPLLDTEVTAWTKLKTSKDKKNKGVARLDAVVRGVHTSLGNYEILATSIAAMGKALEAEKAALVNSPKFAQAIAALPTQNDGYLYLDWDKAETWLEEQIPLLRVIEVAGKPLFDNLRSLTLTSQGSTNGIRRATIFFNLGVRS